MLQTKKISKDAVAVSYDPTAIMLRKSGREFYGTEKRVVFIKDGELVIDEDVAREFNLKIMWLV